MPITAAYQVEVNGLLMGDGTAYDIVGLEGLDMPPVRSADIEFPTKDGVYAGRDQLGPRTITITVNIFGTPGADLAGKVADFATAFRSSNTNVDLVYRPPGRTDRKVNGRPRRCAWPMDLSHEYGMVRAVAEFFCPTPTITEVSTGAAVVY